ncbi:hypothetical protein [Paenibacillus jamilae]|uniref:hypothetical protein n=1 Tax=Paenibacillus jamilae TaxID=114136 RepID=UPI0018D45E6D|nr:hypothetical protein [Paenibacillus jamilae]
MKKTIALAIAAALLGIGSLANQGFISSAQAASTTSDFWLKKNDAGWVAAAAQGKTVVSGKSDTHGGVTLKVSEILYDGLRMNVVIEREGDKKFLKYGQKGAIDKLSFAVDNKDLGFLPTMMTDNIAFVTLANAKKTILPDEFELTVQAKVGQVNEPFIIKVPVRNNLGKVTDLKPGTTKKQDKFTYQIKALRSAGATTILDVESEGPAPADAKVLKQNSATKMYYDIQDDKGKLLLQQERSIENKGPKASYSEQIIYLSGVSSSQFVTIRPFTYTKQKNGKLLADNKGEWIKTYYKSLEAKIPLKN